MSVKQGMKESTVDHLSSETLNLVYLEPVPYNNNNNNKKSLNQVLEKSAHVTTASSIAIISHQLHQLKINDIKQEKSHPCWVYVHLRLM